MRIKSFYILVFAAVIAINAPAQNVGIGTITPTRARLELNGMVGNTTAIFGSDANGIGLTANWPNVEFNAYYNAGHRYIGDGFASMYNLNPDNGYMYFETLAGGSKDALATGERVAMTIGANGRVGIGQNVGLNSQLDVARDPGRDATAFFSAPQWSAFNYGAAEHTYIRGAVAPGKVYFNYYAQYSKIMMGGGGSMVGINWSDPVYPLEIHASDFGIGLMRIGSLNQWLITINNTYLKLMFRSTTANNAYVQLGVFDFTTGQYSASSDRRMKKHIEPLPPTLEKMMQLQPCGYEMKYHNPGHDKTIGLIAQDVKEIFPSLVHVTEDANTGYPGITDVHLLNYSGLAPFVIKALQEQQAQLSKLDERTKILEAQK